MPDTTNIALQLLQLIALVFPAVAIMLQVTNRFAESSVVKMGGTRSDLFSGFFGAALATLFWFSLSAVVLVILLLSTYYVDGAGNELSSVLLGASVIPFMLGILSFLYFAHFPLNITEIMRDMSGVLTQLDKAEAYHEMGIETPDEVEKVVEAYYESTVGSKEALEFFTDWLGIDDVDKLRNVGTHIKDIGDAIEDVERSDQPPLDKIVEQEDSSESRLFRILIQFPEDVVRWLFSEQE